MSRERVRAPIGCAARILYTDNGSGGISICPAKNRVCAIISLKRQDRTIVEILETAPACQLGYIIEKDQGKLE